MPRNVRHRHRLDSKNLDVVRTSQDSEIGCTKGSAGELAPDPLLSSLGACAVRAQPEPERRLLVARRLRRQYRSGGTRYITQSQSINIIEAVKLAKLIDLALVAHLTIHWSLTDVGDDPDGRLFAKVREGLNKWLGRQGIAFAAAWARERQSGGQSAVVHCHMLFHLPVKYRSGKRLTQLQGAILRLVRRHGREVTDERAVHLIIWPDPDGKYLIKGGGPKVWNRFRVRKEHRRSQGIIHGKRCGTTQNIGPAARRRAMAQTEAA